MSGPRTTGAFWTKHAIERMVRYPGLVEADLPDIVAAICDRREGMRMKVSGDGIGFLFHHKGQRLALVVDMDRRLIITFLPPDYYTSGSLFARKKWRSSTDRKIPEDFSQRRAKHRHRAFEID